MTKAFFTGLLCLIFSAGVIMPLAPAKAGTLFPPANIGANRDVPCPNGTVLSWTGDSVVCKDPTPGVSVSCPAGKVMTGISSGQAVCADASSMGGGAASCAVEEWRMGNGFSLYFYKNANGTYFGLYSPSAYAQWGWGLSFVSTLQYASGQAVASGNYNGSGYPNPPVVVNGQEYSLYTQSNGLNTAPMCTNGYWNSVPEPSPS